MHSLHEDSMILRKTNWHGKEEEQKTISLHNSEISIWTSDRQDSSAMSKYHINIQNLVVSSPMIIRYSYTSTHQPATTSQKKVSGVTKGVSLNDDNSLAVSHPCPMFVLCFAALTKSRCLMLSASVQSAWIVPRSLRVKYVLNPWILCDVS